jgi:hypothetical protein
MSNFDTLLCKWKDTLKSRGHSSDLVWLPHESICLRSRVYIRPVTPPMTDAQVRNAFSLLAGKEPSVFMLVGGAGPSYVTLLLDSFGSDSDIFLEQENVFFYANPYSKDLQKDLQIVSSSIQWFYLKALQRISPQLSSLDYAFGIRHALA